MDPTDSLLREIDEDLRRERWQKLWRAFGRYIISFSAVILLGIIGVVVWQQYESRQREAWTSLLLQAKDNLDRGEEDEAKAKLEMLIADGNQDFRVLAKLWLAQAEIKAAKGALPGTIRKELSTISGVGDAYRAYAALLMVGDMEGTTGAERSAKGPFRLTVEEIEAVHHLQKGEKKAAVKRFISLAEDAQAPEAMQERLGVLLSKYGALSDVPKKAKHP